MMCRKIMKKLEIQFEKINNHLEFIWIDLAPKRIPFGSKSIGKL